MYHSPRDMGGKDPYASLHTFAQTHEHVTYPQFDACILRELSLFDVPDGAYIGAVEQMADRIIAALPAFQRIFARPIIRLKDTKEIVPIEAVRIIDNHSLAHASSHSELWEDVADGCIRPRKLMTIEYVETYAIYENIVFAHTVDNVLRWIKHSLMRLKDTLYGCRDLHFNFLDRTHHNLYFLAIGKLHLEYSLAHASHADLTRCMDKLLFIEKTLRKKLSSPVYRSCKGKKKKISLKKTNIFRSHKDYGEIFRIAMTFDNDPEESEEDRSLILPTDAAYRSFCLLLSLFAIGHFHFEFSNEEPICFSAPDVGATFLDWRLRVRTARLEDTDMLLFTVQKEETYTAALIFGERQAVTAERLKDIREAFNASEYCFCSPNSYGEEDTLYLSIFDIDSFRRIQQLLLRCMIYADRTHTHCAFCGQPMKQTARGYECDVCHAVLSHAVCPKTQKEYYVSSIARHRFHSHTAKDEQERRKFLHDRLGEARLHFRNITALTEEGAPVCPHCRRVHEPSRL
ncbi:MAG: hypothetical protein IJW99_03460 [Clostridia bacterium]|nr:hypothetical protein [Clostridia bacterium]